MAVLRFDKRVGALPDPLTPDTVYFQRTGAGIDIRVSDSTGAVAHGLNAPTKTAATLTHTAGAVTLDVQAADLYRFEADEYVPSEITVVGEASDSIFGLGSLSVSLPAGVQEDDVVVVVTTNEKPVTTSGYTLIKSDSSVPKIHTHYKVMGATPDTTVDVSNAQASNIQFIVLRGVDTSTPQDTTHTFAESTSGVPNPPAITTATDAAMLVALIASDADVTGGSHSGYTFYPGEFQAYFSTGISTKTITSAGSDDPPTLTSAVNDDWQVVTTAWRAAPPAGEVDYTFTFSNIPASGIATGLIDIELKTDTGSVAFGGGTVTWIGATPAFDAVGHYLIGFIADATGITLWSEA